MPTLRTLAAAALLSAPLAAGDAFESTTPGKPGSGGVVPVLAGVGPGTPGSTTNALILADALASSSATLVVGVSELAAPFRGGVLGPSPDILLAGLPVDGAGALVVPFALPADMPPELGIWTQFWIDDRGASLGHSATNTVKLTVQPPPAATGLFPGQARLISQGIPSGIDVGDLDGDGVLDLVLAGHGLASGLASGIGEFVPAGGGLSVLLGLGDGEFGEEVVIHTGGAPSNVRLADLDGNGTLDVVASNAATNSVTVLLGTGDGSFGPAQQFSSGSFPSDDLAVADLDGDGTLDLVLAPRNDFAFFVISLLGDGNGNFAAPLTSGVGDSPNAVAIADFDEDGIPDVVAAFDGPGSGGIRIRIGDGDGTFSGGATHGAGTTTEAVAVGDLDGDGHMDVVTPTLIFLGLGDGTLAPPQPFESGALPFQPSAFFAVSPALVLGDLDHDGVLDIVEGGEGLTVGRGTGDGGAAPGENFNVEGSVGVIALRDFDGDGMLDAAVASSMLPSTSSLENGFLTVLSGDPEGSLSAPRIYASGVDTQALIAADIDGDGTQDLALANAVSGDVTILLGTGEGAFVDMGAAPAGSDARALAAGDFDHDGLLDLVVVNRADDTVSVLAGLGGGSFAPPQAHAVGVQPHSVSVADVDGDDVLDIVSTNTGSGDVSVLRGVGDGSFDAAISFAAGEAPESLVVGDLDRDGQLDLAVLNPAADTISLLVGSGDGGFDAPQPLAAGGTPIAIALGDMNGDALPDFVVANAASTSVSVLLATGGGEFAAPVAHAAEHAGPLVIADLDGDGVLDVATRGPAGFSVWLGRGDGDLGAPTYYEIHAPVGASAQDLVGADFDGDGATDIACATRTGLFGVGFDGVTVMPNQR